VSAAGFAPVVAAAANWGFVAAGYLVTAGALGGYAAWLGARLRRARRAAAEDAGE